MLFLDFDPVTTELVFKRVDPTSITVVGATASNFVVSGNFELNNGFFYVNEQVVIPGDSSFTIEGNATLEIF